MCVRENRRVLDLSILLGLFVLLISAVCFGQITTTTMVGTVTDATGAAVPNAHVTVTNTATNLTRNAQTNDQGEYRIEFLPVGDYTVAITAGGFKKAIRNGVVLEVAVPARVDAKLELGEIAQTVEVTSSAPLICL
jgi:Carboxypeptidase regulatory-like domain